MPSVGAASAAVMARRIEAAISTQFPPDQQADARHMLDLASAGGNPWCWHLLGVAVLLAVIGTALWVSRRRPDTAKPASPWWIAACLALAVAAALGCRVSYEKRQKARHDLDALVASDSAKWRPIQAKLEKIILEAGQFPEGQRSSVTHGEGGR
jgi:hypothetical protein